VELGGGDSPQTPDIVCPMLTHRHLTPGIRRPCHTPVNIGWIQLLMYIIIVQFAQWRCWPVLAHRVSLAWRERVNPIRRVSLEGVSEFVASHVHLIRQQQPPRPMLGRTSARASPRERLALHVLRSGASAKQALRLLRSLLLIAEWNAGRAHERKGWAVVLPCLFPYGDLGRERTVALVLYHYTWVRLLNLLGDTEAVAHHPTACASIAATSRERLVSAGTTGTMAQPGTDGGTA
jgi:hypothetical protein